MFLKTPSIRIKALALIFDMPGCSYRRPAARGP
jgi:hypothetical protein